jgi:hypothetical protein
MAWARSHGHPVPRVYGRTGTDLSSDRLEGPTMLVDLGRRRGGLAGMPGQGCTASCWRPLAIDGG